MEGFQSADVVRLWSLSRSKFLCAHHESDRVSVEDNRAVPRTMWRVECVGMEYIFLRAKKERYLVATDIAAPGRIRGYMVAQGEFEPRLARWKPCCNGDHIILRDFFSRVLCANGRKNPYKDYVSSVAPSVHRDVTRSVLWKLEVVKRRMHPRSTLVAPVAPAAVREPLLQNSTALCNRLCGIIWVGSMTAEFYSMDEKFPLADTAQIGDGFAIEASLCILVSNLSRRSGAA